MKKKTDAGYDIPEEDLKEMQEEKEAEILEGMEGQTGYCRFCGQAGIVHTIVGGEPRGHRRSRNMSMSVRSG